MNINSGSPAEDDSELITLYGKIVDNKIIEINEEEYNQLYKIKSR